VQKVETKMTKCQTSVKEWVVFIDMDIHMGSFIDMDIHMGSSSDMNTHIRMIYSPDSLDPRRLSVYLSLWASYPRS
jgi:hypothetical protein